MQQLDASHVWHGPRCVTLSCWHEQRAPWFDTQQGPASHGSVSWVAPTQLLPPLLGLGFVQLRVRVRRPWPQVTLQLPNVDHEVHLPLTEGCWF